MLTSRERILAHLKRSPGAGVDALTKALGLAPMTIRQHLARMDGEGLVEATSERRPTGRPAHVFHLTAKGDDQFPKAYDRLASLLIDELAELDPAVLAGLSTPDRRALLLRRLAHRAAEPRLDRLQRLDGKERALAAAAILQEESGFIQTREISWGLDVRDYNCIYRRVAEEHHDICTFHVEYVSWLTGAEVELTESHCNGASACCFMVRL